MNPKFYCNTIPCGYMDGIVFSIETDHSLLQNNGDFLNPLSHVLLNIIELNWINTIWPKTCQILFGNPSSASAATYHEFVEGATPSLS